MKKYLGSHMTAYAATIAPFFIILPIAFSIIVLSSEISTATVFLTCMFCCCSFVWSIYIKREIIQLYAWGHFEKNRVTISCPLIKKYSLEYEKCRTVGIGYYTHGILNSRFGTKVYFIYLSYDYFDAKYSEKINLWKPNNQRIKVQFDHKLYTYLISTLPQKQAKMLQQSYRNSPLWQLNLEKN